MINVLFLIDSFRMGGAERITMALLPYFDRTRVNPLVATITTRRESPLGDQLGDVPRFDLEASRLIDPFALRRLVGLIRQQHIHLIHAQLQDSTILATLARLFVRVPIVVTRHLIDDDAVNWRRRWRNQAEIIATRYGVDRIIGVSQAAAENYAKLAHIPLTRFVTVYNGIDVAQYIATKSKTQLRQQLNLPTDQPIITMVGVMRPGKGQEVLIEAAQRIPDALFLLVGDGKPPHRQALEAQAAPLAERVRFLGQRLDIPDILNASDIFVLPSDNEALPTVLLEAGAASLPVVASRVGGIPEIITEGENGLLVPKRDPIALVNALRRLLDTPALRAKMSQQAHTIIQARFTLQKQAETLTHLYESYASR